MKVIAVVHARGRGSTLPKKNIYPLHGKPLIAHFLEEMQKCECLDEICVWTESEEIARVVEACGCHAIERPKSMVHYASGFHTVQEWDSCVAEKLMEKFGTYGDIRVSLNCNYVLFQAATLDRMFDRLLEDPQAHIIFPLCSVEPHIYMINPETDYLFPVWEHPGLDRQKYPKLYRKIGISITHPTRPRIKQPMNELWEIIPWWEGRDIQGEEDVDFAEFMLAKRHKG